MLGWTRHKGEDKSAELELNKPAERLVQLFYGGYSTEYSVPEILLLIGELKAKGLCDVSFGPDSRSYVIRWSRSYAPVFTVAGKGEVYFTSPEFAGACFNEARVKVRSTQENGSPVLLQVVSY